VEIPYQFVQTIIYGVITYFMMGFENNVGKISIFAFEMLPASCIWSLAHESEHSSCSSHK